MTERGRLDYEIRTRDRFTQDLRRFQEEIRASKREFRDFRTELGRLGGTTRRNLNSIRSLRAQTRGLTRDLLNRGRAVDKLTRDLDKFRAAEDRLISQQTTLLQVTSALSQAEARRVRALRNLGRDLRRVATETRRTTESVRRYQSSAQQAAAATGALGGRVTNTTRVVSRLFFSFRRLVGVLAVFSVAREAVTGFNALIREGVEFNSVLEQNQLGIAALITSVGDLRDNFGNTVSTQQRLNLAQGESRRQLELLQREALNTAASFQDLATAFQTGLGFGLDAGLTVDQVRQFAVQISQAASAINLPQNALAEEIRSLLQGTINPRNTQIATILRIGNEDIRRAREAGNLFEFLQQRFEAFQQAGGLITQTFKGLSTNTLDAVRRLLASSGIEFFDELKGLLRDTLGLIQEINQEGFLELSPQARALVDAVLDPLSEVIAEVRRSVASITFEDALPSFEAAGQILSAVGETVVGLVAGLIDAGSVAGNLAAIFRAMVSSLVPLNGLNANLANVVQSLTTVVALLTAASALSTAIRFTVSRWPILAATAGVATLVLGLEKVLDLITGSKTEFSNLTVFTAGAVAAVTKILVVLGGFQPVLRQIAAQIQLNLAIPLRRAFLDVQYALRQLSDEQAAAVFADINAEAKRLKDLLDGPLSNRSLREAEQRQFEEIDRRLGAVIDSGRGVTGVFQEVAEILGISTQEVENQSRALKEQDGILVRNVRRLRDEQELVQQLTKGYADAAQALARQRALADTTTGGTDQRAALQQFQTEVQIQERSLKFLQERSRLTQEITRLEQNLGLIRAENAERAFRGVGDFIGEDRTLGEINAKRQQLAGIEQDIAEIRRRSQEIADLGLLALETETANKLDLNEATLQGLELERQAQALANAGFGTRAALLQSQAQLLALKQQEQNQEIAFSNRISALRQAEARTVRDIALARSQGALQSARIVDLTTRLGQIQGAVAGVELERLATNKEISLEIQKQADGIKNLTTTIEGPAQGGIEGLIAKWQDARHEAETYANALNSAVALASQSISDALVDALDPTTDTDLLARFQKFLSDLSRMILQTFIQLGIQKAIAGAFGSALGGVAGAGSGGAVSMFDKGGYVSPGLAKSVRGYARGGSVFPRPASIPSSDTVPAWLTPKEFVMPVPAVSTYGTEVFEALRRRLIDPAALKAMAGVRGALKPRVPRVASFAEGGAVSADATLPSAQPAAQVSLQRAVVVADEGTMERLLAQGRRPMLDLLRNEVPQIVAEARGSGLI